MGDIISDDWSGYVQLTASTGWPLLTGTDFMALNAATKSEQTIKDCRQIVHSDNIKLPPPLTYLGKEDGGSIFLS